MTEYAYILLTNSNSSLSKRFRVIADGYDDGTPEKTVSIAKTIGGDLDVSQGAIFRSWAPVIKVRHTEEDSNYGTLDELEAFFSYNNPNSTPSDKITFTDNHGKVRTVIMMGTLRKSLVSARIEGTTAWYHVQLILQGLKSATSGSKHAYAVGV